MLRALHVPLTWGDLLTRTGREVIADNCLGLAAELGFYFFLALFPALLFLVSLVSYVPVHGLIDAITGSLAQVAPYEVLALIKEQLLKVAQDKNGGLLTLGAIGTIWSTSSGVSAVIDTLNATYDVRETRPWWKTKLIAIGLTIALALFTVISFVLVVAGPELAGKVAGWVGLGAAFAWTWKIVQWPLVFLLVTFGVAMIYYYAPDVQQEWSWITPGSVLATILWILISLGFRLYVQHFTSYTATYGAIGTAIVAMLWFYVSGLAVLIGGELNAEIEHASPLGKDPGERVAGEKAKHVEVAARAYAEQKAVGMVRPALAAENCDVDAGLPPAAAARGHWRRVGE